MIRQPVFQFLLKDNRFNCCWFCMLQPTEHLVQPGPELIMSGAVCVLGPSAAYCHASLLMREVRFGILHHKSKGAKNNLKTLPFHHSIVKFIVPA